MHSHVIGINWVRCIVIKLYCAYPGLKYTKYLPLFSTCHPHHCQTVTHQRAAPMAVYISTQ